MFFNVFLFILMYPSSIYCTYITFYLFISLYQSKFTAISFHVFLFISIYPSSIYCTSITFYLFLSLCQSKFTAISLNVLLFILLCPSSMYLYHFLCLSISLSIRNHGHIYKPLFFISVYSSCIRLYLFLSLFQPPLFPYNSLSIQIYAYLFQPHFLYFSLILIYPVVFIFIYFLSTIISFYLLFI